MLCTDVNTQYSQVHIRCLQAQPAQAAAGHSIGEMQPGSPPSLVSAGAMSSAAVAHNGDMGTDARHQQDAWAIKATNIPGMQKHM